MDSSVKRAHSHPRCSSVMRCADLPNKMPRSNCKKVAQRQSEQKLLRSKQQSVALEQSVREPERSGIGIFAAILQKALWNRDCFKNAAHSFPRASLTVRHWADISRATELTDSVPDAFCCCKLLINNGNWRFTRNLGPGPASHCGPSTLQLQSQPFLTG